MLLPFLAFILSPIEALGQENAGKLSVRQTQFSFENGAIQAVYTVKNTSDAAVEFTPRLVIESPGTMQKVGGALIFGATNKIWIEEKRNFKVLAPGVEESISFDFPLSSHLPNAEYIFTFEALSKLGDLLAGFSSKKNITGDGVFLELTQENCEIHKVINGKKYNFHPQEAGWFDSGEEVEAVCRVKNLSKSKVEARVSALLNEYTVFGYYLAEPQKLEGEIYKFGPLEEKTMVFAMPVQNKPQVYEYQLQFIDAADDAENRISALTALRWTVRGGAARLVSWSLDKPYQAGEPMEFTVLYYGSPDLFWNDPKLPKDLQIPGSEIADAKLIVAVTDINGNACGNTEKALLKIGTLDLQSVNLSVDAGRCDRPQISLKLASASQILSSADVKVPQTPAPARTAGGLTAYAVIAALLFAGAALFWWKKKSNGANLLILMFLLASAIVLAPEYAFAQIYADYPQPTPLSISPTFVVLDENESRIYTMTIGWSVPQYIRRAESMGDEGTNFYFYNLNNCTAGGDWSGTKALSGSETLNFGPLAAGKIFNFTLTCNGNEVDKDGSYIGTTSWAFLPTSAGIAIPELRTTGTLNARATSISGLFINEATKISDDPLTYRVSVTVPSIYFGCSNVTPYEGFSMYVDGVRISFSEEGTGSFADTLIYSYGSGFSKTFITQNLNLPSGNHELEVRMGLADDYHKYFQISSGRFSGSTNPPSFYDYNYTDIDGTNYGNLYVLSTAAGNAYEGVRWSDKLTQKTTLMVVPPSMDFSMSNDGAKTVTNGYSTSNRIRATYINGVIEPIIFSITSPPITGANFSFSQGSCTPTCSTILTIETSPSTPRGIHNVEVMGTAGGITRTTSFQLNVINQTVLPELAISPLAADPNELRNIIVNRNPASTALGAINYSIWWDCNNSSTDVGAVEGDPACGDLPFDDFGGGCTTSNAGAKCDGETATSLTVSYSGYATNGTAKVIMEQGTARAERRVPVAVNLGVSCFADQTVATMVDDIVTWTAVPSGGSGSYNFTWSGDDPLDGAGGNPIYAIYTSSGTKTGAVTVNDGLTSVGPLACDNSPISITGRFIDFNVAPRPINSGQSTTIVWDTEGFNVCTLTDDNPSTHIDGQQVADKCGEHGSGKGKGKFPSCPVLNLASTTVFTMICDGVMRSVSVLVKPPPSFIEITPP